MTMYLLNAFSLNMVDAPCDISVEQIVFPGLVFEKGLKNGCVVSAVGHADTANVFGSILGCTVMFNRMTVKLERGDSAIVGQYSGPRLEEGATTLPEGATIKWLLVTIS